MHKKKRMMLCTGLFLILLLPLTWGAVCDASAYLDLTPISGELLALDVSSLSASPTSEVPGTVFTIRATIYDEVPVSTVTARLYDNGTLLDQFSLYDDGLHGDGAAQDTVYANTWDSSGFGDGTYDAIVSVTNAAGQAANGTQNGILQLLSTNCKTLQSRGPAAAKLDIVFVPCDYSAGESAKFETDARAHMDELLSFSPFDEYPNSVNAYLVDRPGEISCTHSPCLLANGADVRAMADECSSWDTIVVIADSEAWEGCAYLGGVAHSASRYPWITVHEFGHSFGYLYDEYIAVASGSSSAIPNCDVTSACSKWSGVPETGCYSGCYTNDMYRSINSGTMRTGLAQDFGVWNKGLLRQRLDTYD